MGRDRTGAGGTRTGGALRAALLAAAALVGCQTAAGPAPTAGGITPVAVGPNLLGEDCRFERAASASGPGRVGELFEIHCGRWEQPSARIVRAELPQPLETLVAGGDWRGQIEAFATCRDPEPATLPGDVPAKRLDCVIRRGGWPYGALVARVGDTVYFGDAIPAALPVLERSIGLLSGRGTETPAVGAPGGGPAKGLYSAGDLAEFRQVLRRAQYHNFQGQHPEAEKLYRRALALQHDRLAKDDAGLIFVLMNLALELSNQERFIEAERCSPRPRRCCRPRSIPPTKLA